MGVDSNFCRNSGGAVGYRGSVYILMGETSSIWVVARSYTVLQGSEARESVVHLCYVIREPRKVLLVKGHSVGTHTEGLADFA